MVVTMNGLQASIVVSRGERHIDVDFEVAPGETVVLVGPNGAGKSTIIDCLAGLVAVDAGRIVIDGRVVDDPVGGLFVPASQRQVGVVFQQGALFGHLDVRDNVAFGLIAAGMRRRQARREAQGWLDRYGLDQLGSRLPGTLSGGEAQRVALARTLATEPRVLALDEPFAAVDIASRGWLRSLVADQLRGFDGPRIIVTHDPTDMYLLADRVLVIEEGIVTQTGTTEALRRHPKTAYAAALAGTNLLHGQATAGVVTIDGTGHQLHVADTQAVGSVLVTIAPNAVSLHDLPPRGSARNAWPTTVVGIAPLGDVSRVLVEGPVSLAVDVTPASVEQLGVQAGQSVWVAIKATEIVVRGDERATQPSS